MGNRCKPALLMDTAPRSRSRCSTVAPMPDTGLTLSPVIRYDDAHAAIDFLCEAFGFERETVAEDEGGEVVHAELRHGDSWLMTGNARKDFPADAGGGSGIY